MVKARFLLKLNKVRDKRMRISDLKRNDVIKIFGQERRTYILAIVDETGGTNRKEGIYFWAKS